MTMRKWLTIILLFVSSLASHARLPEDWLLSRFHYGLEWGYSQCLWLHRDYNITSVEGYRIYEKSQGFYLKPNGMLLGRVGYPLSEEFELSLLGGWMGTGKDNRFFPLLMRLSWYFQEEGFFAHVQGGVAWHTPAGGGFAKMAGTASAGSGYRIALGSGLNLDFMVSARYLHDHPLIPNPEGPGNVLDHNIRKNLAEYLSLDFSVALSF